MFSIVIPLFNASVSIEKTLASCTSQTLSPKEIIIVDDGSTDNSYALVQQWKAQYSGGIEIILKKMEKNSGPSKARNQGWDLASAEFIAFLDADDSFIAEKLEKVRDVLAQHNDIVLLGHGYSVNDGAINESTVLQKMSTKALLFKNLTTTPSVIVKRDIPERFDESMRYTEDHDLWLRITKAYDRTYYLDAVLTMIGRPVRTAGGQSANLWAMRQGEIKMYYKYCKKNGLLLLLPAFTLFSLGKHGYKMLRERV